MTKADIQGPSPRAISHPTPAESLASSGLIDVAAGIADFCHSLTGSVMRAIEISERGSHAALDTCSLRAAVFHGVAEHIIKAVEQRLRRDQLPTRDGS
jgi:hypothetical protein